MADTEPARGLELEIEDEEPLNDAAPSGPVSNADAPYGYKKDGTPARKRGRKPGQTNGSSSGPSRARSSGSRGSLQQQIGGLIFTFNIPLQMALPRDALDTTEVLALAKAIDDECQRNARFRKIVEQALAVQGGTSLLLVISAIVGRRVVRHDLITLPEEVGGNAGADAALGAVIGFTVGQQPQVNIADMLKQTTTSSES